MKNWSIEPTNAIHQEENNDIKTKMQLLDYQISILTNMPEKRETLAIKVLLTCTLLFRAYCITPLNFPSLNFIRKKYQKL